MKNITAFLLALTLVACQATSSATNSTTTATSNQGFSEQRLTRINTVMQQYIDDNKLAGVMTLVARNGEVVHWASQGMQDREAQIPLDQNTIFRIYSMTKPVTAVAALTLWEQGKFHMQDPIDKYLPELKNLKVYVSGTGEDMVLEDAKFPIRIIDLFTHTAGFSYGFTNSEVDKLYRAMISQDQPGTSEESMQAVAKLPLNHQPGTAWHYGVNTDILGFLVERLSGMKLGEYMKKHIFDPLDMKDTGFAVAAADVNRLAQIYTVGDKGQTIVMNDEPLGDYMSDPNVHNGGGGLVSTMSDYLTFAQMLLNGGEYNGERILGRKTVEYMRSNHLPDNLVPFNAESTGEGYGLAMSVTVDPGQSRFMSSQGNYGWAGAASTYFRIDPEENMIMISMAQFIPVGFHNYHNDFRNLVYQALVD